MRRLRTGILGIALCGLAADPGSSRHAAAAPAAAIAPAPSPAAPDGSAASREIAAASVSRAVADLGHLDGFYLNPNYHITLSAALSGPIKTLSASYAGGLADTVERTVNHAAELTTPPAGDFILKSLPAIALPPPGPGDGIAVALRRKIEKPLREAMAPVMTANLTEAEADAAFQRLRVRYEAIAGAPMPGFNLQAFALDSFIDTFFRRIADEEHDLRTRPSLRDTDALRRAFAQ